MDFNLCVCMCVLSKPFRAFSRSRSFAARLARYLIRRIRRRGAQERASNKQARHGPNWTPKQRQTCPLVIDDKFHNIHERGALSGRLGQTSCVGALRRRHQAKTTANGHKLAYHLDVYRLLAARAVISSSLSKCHLIAQGSLSINLDIVVAVRAR